MTTTERDSLLFNSEYRVEKRGKYPYFTQTSAAMSLKQLSWLLLLLLGFMKHRVEGVCSVDHCTNNTRCLLSTDQRSCKCTTGYYGDQCDKDAGIKVVCSKNYISVRVLEDFFKYYKVPLESLHLPNKSCRAQRAVIHNVPYYISRISKDDYLTCGGKPLEKNFTHISYSLSLLSDPQVFGNIIRSPIIRMDYKCVYPYVRKISLSFPIVPFSSETVMRLDELDATIQMMLYTDHSFAKAYTSAPTIELRDKVYVEVTVTEPADFFLLHIDECWATQFPHPNTTEGSFHNLILNGSEQLSVLTKSHLQSCPSTHSILVSYCRCADDQTVSFLSASEGQSFHNGESSTVRYSFDMFRFTSEPHDLYLHCSVQLCEPDDHKSCTPNCNSISKREAVRADPARGLLSYGPIRIEMPQRSHSSIVTTVVLPVAAVWTVGLFVIILIAVAKEGSRRLTQKKADNNLVTIE
ncbi:uncharacterized protein V6R79_007673 [Siganus canaliculatus]